LSGPEGAISGESEAQEYRRGVRAWVLYDWANSGFATVIIAAILPLYYSQIARSTLGSAASATAVWSAGLSISLLVSAGLSPVLGTISDIKRSKKRFLAIFCGLGVTSTALLVLVQSGDWLLASGLFILGRIGFTAANTFYDAMLPHVARGEDRHRVSAQGFAAGYLGGGLLLGIDLLLIWALPGNWGARLSFLSVALWWALFAIPLLRYVPEPQTATAHLGPGESVLRVSFQRLGETLKDMRHYRELFKGLLAILLYADGIGTLIGMAAIYGAELGFKAGELLLALLVVQFAAIPYSLIFGRLPDPAEKRRAFFLAFILFNAMGLPLLGISASRLLPAFSNSIGLAGAGAILGGILLVQAIGLILAWLVPSRWLAGLVRRMDARNCILLALGIYALIAAWGYFLHSVVEFWCLAWLVAVVQGGTQALSRSLFSSLAPASKSGEFFGLFGVMEKFAAILGPLLFSMAALLLGSSRPAVLSVIVFFVAGGLILRRVDIAAGQRVAQAEDAQQLEALHGRIGQTGDGWQT
jgi:MFS transporter, UMF1 family